MRNVGMRQDLGCEEVLMATDPGSLKWVAHLSDLACDGSQRFAKPGMGRTTGSVCLGL